MKALIDRSGCIGCGLCAQTCPEVFEIEDDGLAAVHEDPVPSAVEEETTEARDNCPVSVISIE